jgi:hypothetical protein
MAEEEKIETKTCRLCNVTKEVSEFQYRKDRKTYRNECKLCKQAYMQTKNYKHKTKEEKLIKQQEKEAKLNVKDKICEECHILKPITEFELRTDTKEPSIRNQCKSCVQAYRNKYQRENEEYKIKYNAYKRNRYKTDIQFKLTGDGRGKITKIINKIRNGNADNKMTFLGCTSKELKKYFEKKFYNDINWTERNFQVDHKIPISWFDLTNEKLYNLCFNYKNLQPLTIEDHKKKGSNVWTDYDLKKNPYI